MERIISPEERMRRAEEIYYKRKAQGTGNVKASVSVENVRKVSLKKKMMIQICICVLIYSGLNVLKNYNNIFSQNIIDKTKYFLSYDLNFQKIYFDGIEYFKSKFNNNVNDNANVNYMQDKGENQEENKDVNEDNKKDIKDGNTDNKDENTGNNGENDENKNEQTQDKKNDNNVSKLEDVGGGSDISNNNEQGINDGTLKAKVDSENKTQMEQDAEFIKQNFSFIHPVEGKITSGFGSREETEIISAFHQGIDISAVTGTPIKSAISGTVVASSYAGDYGNHVKIQNGDVLTVYAHCSVLEVKVGDEINQGQEIAKVGTTGKVTGAHLHFEIRREGRYVDPQMILNF